MYTYYCRKLLSKTDCTCMHTYYCRKLSCRNKMHNHVPVIRTTTMGKKIYEKQGTFIRRKFKTFCPTLPTWNGTLDRGLNTQHGVFVCKISKHLSPKTNKQGRLMYDWLLRTCSFFRWWVCLTNLVQTLETEKRLFANGSRGKRIWWFRKR
jgi:hypothetical protein